MVCHSLLPSHPTPKSQPQLNFSQSQEVRFAFAETFRVSTPNTSWPMQLPLSVSRYWAYRYMSPLPPEGLLSQQTQLCVCAYAHLTNALVFADYMQPSPKSDFCLSSFIFSSRPGFVVVADLFLHPYACLPVPTYPITYTEYYTNII